MPPKPGRETPKRSRMLTPKKRKTAGQSYKERGIAPPRRGGKAGQYAGRSAAAERGHETRRRNAARRRTLSFVDRRPGERVIGRFAVHVYEIGRGFRQAPDPDAAIHEQMRALVAPLVGRRCEVVVNFVERDENGERAGRRRLVRTVPGLTFDKVFSPGGALHAAMKEAFDAYKSAERLASGEGPREINISSITITPLDEPPESTAEEAPSPSPRPRKRRKPAHRKKSTSRKKSTKRHRP